MTVIVFELMKRIRHRETRRVFSKASNLTADRYFVENHFYYACHLVSPVAR